MHDGPSDTDSDVGVKIGWVGRSAFLAAAYFPVLALYGFGIALPPIAAAFAGQPHAVLLSQLVGSIIGFAFALGSLSVGRLIDRFGYRSVLLVSAASFAIIGAAGGLLDNLHAILATRVLLGFAVAGALLGSLAGIGALPPRQRVRMFGLQAVVGGLMAIGTFPLVGWLASIGWRWPFALHLAGLLVLPLILGLPKGHVAKAIEASGSRRRLAGVPPVLLLVTMFMGMASIVGPIFSPFFLSEIGIRSPTQQSIPLMAMGAAGIVSSSMFGWLHHRLGTTGTFAASLLVCGSGLILGSLAHSLAIFALALAVTALGISAFTPNLSAAVVAAAGESRGRALGLASAAMYGAQAFFPFAANSVNRSAGSAAVFSLFGVAAFGIGLGFFFRTFVARGGIEHAT